MSSDADRQRLRRQRKRAGIVVVPVSVSFDVLDSLADAGLVAWNESDRGAIGEAATNALHRWACVTRDGVNADDVVASEHDYTFDNRDHVLRVGARRHFPNVGPDERAQRMADALSRYRGGAWREDRSRARCPYPGGGLLAVLWQVLKERDRSITEAEMKHILLEKTR
jgi:hypothetical protein